MIRRIMPFLMLVAFVLAPFAPMAHAMPSGSREPAAATGHCAGMELPQDHKSGKAGLELCCQLACAVVAPAPAEPIQTFLVPALGPGFTTLSVLAGLHTGADPPPPKAS